VLGTMDWIDQRSKEAAELCDDDRGCWALQKNPKADKKLAKCVKLTKRGYLSFEVASESVVE